MVLSGIILFLFSFVLFWYVPAMDSSYQWAWKVLVAIAMVVTVLGYEHAEPKAVNTV
ncbi:MAG: hypothetical protein U5J63_01145 [Fodinibius sp.]|nr:hypothetical protein [Fodinibius sp.]